MATERYGQHGQAADRHEPPVVIRNCSRVGRTANPPRPRLGGWLRRR